MNERGLFTYVLRTGISLYNSMTEPGLASRLDHGLQLSVQAFRLRFNEVVCTHYGAERADMTT